VSFYQANDKYDAQLTSAFTAGQTTMSVNVVPDNVPTLVCIAKGTVKEAIYIVTDTTLNSLTGVSRLKGYDGNLDTGMPITCLNNEEFVNQYSAAVSTPDSLIQILYGIDGGSTDDYVVSLDVAPTAYTAGMLVSFKANTANTGACTLNLNSLGAKAIKKNTSEDLTTDDIKAGQVVVVVYDGTNFQLQTGIPTIVSYPRAFTWYLDGTSIVADEVGAKYIVPANMTVVSIKAKTVSGTATIRLQKDTTDVDASISVTSSVATETSITSAALTADQVLTLDITAASSCVGLSVIVNCTM